MPRVHTAAPATVVTHAVLLPLAAVLAALLLVACSGLVPGARRLAALLLAPLCALGAALSLTALADGGVASLGGPVPLVLDPLSALFLLLMFIPAAACLWHARDNDRARPALAAAAVAMALTLLTADGFIMALGLCLTAISFWAAAPAGRARRAMKPFLAASCAGALCLIAAFALLAPSGDAGFAPIRAASHQGRAAEAAVVLALLGSAPLAGLAPLHVWLPAAHRGVRGPAAALLSGAASAIGLYLIVRLLLDLSGEAAYAWWPLPLVLGAVSVPLGAVRMLRARDMVTVLAAGTITNTGLTAVGIGVVLLGGQSDLPSLASLALYAVLLLALGHALVKTALLLAADSAERAAGTMRLGRMGGLIHRMPVATAAMLAGGASLAALPPSVGFAGAWLLLEALIAGAQGGTFAVRTFLAASFAAVALGLGLVAVAALRLVGIAFLGRPRTPRAAAAEEGLGPGRLALLGITVLGVLPGLLPGPTLDLFAPVLHRLLGTALDGRTGPLAVAPQAGAPGYSALGIVALLLACGGAAVLALRRWAASGNRREPAWEGGFAAAPPWLPFGDPLTQIGPGGFAQPLLAPFAPLVAAWRRLRAWLLRRTWSGLHAGSPLAAALVALTVLLFLAAWFGRP